MASLPEPIDAYMTAYNALDLPGMLACLADDVHFRNLSGGKLTAETTGKQAFEELARIGIKIVASRRQMALHAITVADTTLVEIAYCAVVASHPPSGWTAGERIELVGASLFRLDGGKIVQLIDRSR